MNGRCAGCGAEVDGDVCDWRCEQIADREAKWRGKEPCEKCMEDSDQNDWEPATHGDLCERHEEQRNEGAHERSLSDYYGGTGPRPLSEGTQ